jgi:hypothetical protein
VDGRWLGVLNPEVKKVAEYFNNYKRFCLAASDY